MASNPGCTSILIILLLGSFELCLARNLSRYFDITWGDGRAKFIKNGKELALSLDRESGSEVQSKQEFLFGKIDMQLKLVPGNSAGTVTAYYLSSQGSAHDEIDFEFLGNISGDPYIVHTNVYTQGKGDREQQFYLWFDPTEDFHNYSILWNPQTIILYVDGTPIRVFKNLGLHGVPFPDNQPMRVYASLWDAEDWATRGGLVKTDWSQSPFSASLRNFKSNVCSWKSNRSSCHPSPSSNSSSNNRPWFYQEFDSESEARLNWVQQNYMAYDYCTDLKRFTQGIPPECTYNATAAARGG